MKVAAILPAYNEEDRIARVLEAVVGAKLVDEVIVVSDGSTDSTAEIAEAVRGVRVVRLEKNVGKGGAMAEGVRATEADVIVFLDADLVGLRSQHVDDLVEPVLNGADMCVGVFRKGKLWSDAAQAIVPLISGQRALKRSLIDQIPWLDEVRMGVEVTLNQFARKRKMRIHRITLRGVSHTCKERKFGLVNGTKQRAKMYAEIGKAMVRTRKKMRLH